MYSDGYKYWLAYRANSISYYRCFRHTSSKCPGRCVSEDGKVRITAVHNHPPEVDKALVDKFRKVLTNRAATENTELYAIYCDEATTRHSDAAMLYPFSSAESAMRKARRKQLPQSPNSIGELVNVLNNSIDLFRVHSGNSRDSIYQKTINLEDSVCMIFMHRKTYELFDRIEEILLDSTFEFVPEFPPNYYLLTIHAVKQDITAPIVYAILTAKTQSAYSTFFAYLREELNIIPNTIICDFDQLVQTSLAYTFPEAIIKGSWFHYTDAVLLQMRSLGLQRETAKGLGASALRMLLVLPLLPAEYMSPGLESLKKWLKEKNIFSNGFSKLCDYVENSWLRAVGAEKMSIFGTTRILLNHTRNFNKELLGIIGNQNLIIWIILDSITQLATKIYVKINKKMKQMNASQSLAKNFSCARSHQLSMPPSSKRPKKKKDLVTDTIISNATQFWIKTPVHLRNPLQFLQLSSHCINDSIYLSNLSDVKEKLFAANCCSEMQMQNNISVLNSQYNDLNCWNLSQSQNMSEQQQLQLHHQQQQQSIQQQNQLQQELTDLSSVNFLMQESHLEQADFNVCSLEQEFMLAQPQNHSLNLEANNDQNAYSCLTSCSVINQTISQQTKNFHSRPISSNPPPLAFFPSVKKLPCKRRLPILSEPPPLVPIKSKMQCKRT